MHSNIDTHITQTYVSLRVGMALMAIALPIVLFASAWYFDSFNAQQSISRYYHTPMRDFFVGSLIAIGAFLYLYKGFTTKENILLNFAGVFAVLVAWLPTDLPAEVLRLDVLPPYLPRVPFIAKTPHVVSAFLFFAAIGYVAVFCSEATLEKITDAKKREVYRRCYRTYGILMIALPALAALLTFFTVPRFTVFIVQTIAITVFSAFWITKSFEIKEQGKMTR